jgi:hypothetical protein
VERRVQRLGDVRCDGAESLRENDDRSCGEDDEEKQEDDVADAPLRASRLIVGRDAELCVDDVCFALRYVDTSSVPTMSGCTRQASL